MAMKAYSIFLKVLRLERHHLVQFSVLTGTQVGGGNSTFQECSGRILQPQGCPRGVMVKAMDCGIVVREFVLQSRYYVHFRTNTLGKGMNSLILPAMG